MLPACHLQPSLGWCTHVTSRPALCGSPGGHLRGWLACDALHLPCVGCPWMQTRESEAVRVGGCVGNQHWPLQLLAGVDSSCVVAHGIHILPAVCACVAAAAAKKCACLVRLA